MKRTTVIILYLLFINNLLFAQSIVFLDSIKWERSQVLIDVGLNREFVMSFDGCYNRFDDLFPIYSAKKEIHSNLKVDNFSIKNLKYEEISLDSVKQVKNLDKLSNDFEIKFSNSVFRKKNNISINILPIRKNSSTGSIEILTYFEIEANCLPADSRNEKSLKNRVNNYVSSSRLSDGKWYKIKVDRPGVYKITYSDLLEMGFTNMSNIGVFGYGGIPSYKAGEFTADDLPERSVFKVDRNGNGSFDEGDYFLFYAEGPDNVDFKNADKFSHDMNTCSKYAYYFISDRGSWKQAETVESLDDFNANVSTFDDYLYIEKDSVNLLNSGRTFFWSHFNHKLSHNYSINIPNLELSKPVKITIDAAARSTVPSSMSVAINGSSKPSISFYKVSVGTETGNYASYSSNEFLINPSSNNFNINLSYAKSSSFSEAWLNFISVQFKRNLKLFNGQVFFRDFESVGAGKSAKFNISNANNKTLVWDISNKFSNKLIKGKLDGSVYSFIATSDELKEYLAFDYSYDFPSPIYKDYELGFIDNQNLHSLGFADLIIIVNKDFYSQAKSLAEIHARYDNMSSHVVLQEHIFNEFSSGTPSVSAIRNFVKMFYDRAKQESEMPSNLVLFGDGSYDNISRDKSVSNSILTYQTVESLNLTNSIVLDDFFGYLDDGENGESYSEDIDIGIGRIPVKTVAEAENYIEKLRTYYSVNSFGNYKNNMIVIGDDADHNQPIHQQSANRIAIKIENLLPACNVEKVFLDDYPQISTSSGQSYPEVNQILDNYINTGVGIVTWVGHGSPRSWAHERILTIDMIKKWKNKNKYPIFVSATCSFSPFDNHNFVSGGEEVILCENAGGILLFGTTRVAFAGPNETITNAFFKELFTKDSNGKNQTVGMSATKAKNTLPGDSNKRIYTILGNPAIRYFSPNYQVKTLKINGKDVESFNDLIKAKELVKFEAEVVNPDGSLASDFNGIVYPTVYDKKMKYETRDNEGYGSLKYSSQKNILFNGKASVKNGKFSFSFIVPVDIAYFNERGKVSYYAHDYMKNEACGADTSFFVGGSITDDIADKEGPQIELFFNDEQFIPGSIVDESPLLLANVQDESGINTVGNSIGHDITLVIDEKTSNTIVLNKFYETEIDNFTKGKINYPMSSLSVGPHTITVKAWDVLNNSSISTIDCIVANSDDLVLEHLFNYPNPFTTNTSFYFDHNQPFVKLDVIIQIFTISGKHVKTIYRDMITTGYVSEPIIWDGKDEYGDKIGKGVYIYKVKVKTQNGLNADKFEKLVILN